MKSNTLIMSLFALALLLGSLNATNYIINLNGSLNSTWASTNTFTGFINNTNQAVGGGEGWLIALIPFIIILVGLSTQINPTGAAMIASMVGAGITVVESGFITYAIYPFSIYTQLYLFIALIIIFGMAYLLTGADNTYS